METQSKVIILKTIKYGEADLIVKALDREGAGVSYIAKSALRSKKRFGGGVLEPTHYVQVTYKEVPSHSDKLPILQEAKVIEGFQDLRSDYDRLEMALYFVNLVEKISQEGDVGGRPMFDLLGHALRAAETSESLNLLKTQFELKMLSQQGVLPPELMSREFLEPTVKDHEKVEIPQLQLQVLRSALSPVLRQYLNH